MATKWNEQPAYKVACPYCKAAPGEQCKVKMPNYPTYNARYVYNQMSGFPDFHQTRKNAAEARS